MRTTDLTRAIIDRGTPVEDGFQTFANRYLRSSTPAQVADMKVAFFAGAQHVFGMMIAMVDEDAEEVTETDLGRMDKIHSELNRWLREFKHAHAED